jgi:hypothetical protein
LQIVDLRVRNKRALDHRMTQMGELARPVELSLQRSTDPSENGANSDNCPVKLPWNGSGPGAACGPVVAEIHRMVVRRPRLAFP